LRATVGFGHDFLLRLKTRAINKSHRHSISK
jgi:hypothetical protein